MNICMDVDEQWRGPIFVLGHTYFFPSGYKVWCMICIGYTPRARLLSDLATECRRHEVAKSLGNQARGVQPACTMTTQNSKIRLISSIALKSRLITYLST